jgi:GH25 family lysozyme M1 (1,4-beta-N-acetylmuramidase)
VVRGIDVSSYQDRVDWHRVKADGIAFAFVKASEGVTFADPKYRAHETGAKAVGIATGAYHFARPDTHTQDARADARAEADWFLSIAAPRSGDLLPVLDLETAGLPPARMVEWTRAWLDRVRTKIGARPILYTYPAFWEYMGGTTTFRNYPLWIANYGVSAPTLPAGWRRYAVWQYTASATVDGIAGRTDVNRLGDGVALRDLTYRPGRRPPPRPHNLSGPVPKPSWFWPWLRWRLGTGEFEGLGDNERVRPDEAPEQIPTWAHSALEKLVKERRRKK